MTSHYWSASHFIGICAENPLVPSGFPIHRASIADVWRLFFHETSFWSVAGLECHAIPVTSHGRHVVHLPYKKETSGPWFNVKMLSYQFRKSHCGDKTILRPSYLHNGISYTGKMISLYWIRAQRSTLPAVGEGVAMTSSMTSSWPIHVLI